jgi:hypothetical protein
MTSVTHGTCAKYVTVTALIFVSEFKVQIQTIDGMFKTTTGS